MTILKSLQEWKTLLNKTIRENSLKAVKEVARKKIMRRIEVNMLTSQKLQVFNQLQTIFSYLIILTHFDSVCQLYMNLNALKKYSFRAHIYYCCNENEFKVNSELEIKQKNIKFIYFLSKLLTNAETQYWLTELKVTDLVWVIQKIQHMIKSVIKVTIIYTDHFITVNIVCQLSLSITLTEKMNLHSIWASEYLQCFCLNVHYKSDKFNVISDMLFRLAEWDYHQKSDTLTLNTLYTMSVCSDRSAAYSISLIELNTEFWECLITEYTQNICWIRVKVIIEANRKLNENISALSYKMIGSLIYYKDSECSLWLNISAVRDIEKKIFQQAHNELRYSEYTKTHECFTEELYFFNLLKKLHEFIYLCSQCHLCQTSKHKLYKALQLILISSQSFHTISLDFILGLSVTSLLEKYDCLMSITDKFSKAINFISDRITWNNVQWVIRLLNHLTLINWGLLKAILTDRDLKFVTDIWKKIFK